MVTEAAINGNSNVMWVLQSWEKLSEMKEKVQLTLNLMDHNE